MIGEVLPGSTGTLDRQTMTQASRGMSRRDVLSSAVALLAIAGLACLAVVGCGERRDDGGDAQQGAWRSLQGPSPGDVYPLGTILALAIDPEQPQIVYAVERSLGVFKSTDGGRHWRETNTGLPAAAHGPNAVQVLALDPTRPTTVYAGLAYGADGVAKSTDGGRHWRTFGRDVVGDVLALVVDPKNPATVYVAGPNGTFKSTDGGHTWGRAGNAGGNNTALAIDPGQPETIYLARESGSVTKSTDGGLTWSSGSPAVPQASVDALAIDPNAPDTIYAGFYHGVAEWEHGGVYKSTDGGQTWRSSNDGLPVLFGSPSARAFAVDPNQKGVIYVAAQIGRYQEGGVFRSTDGGETWHDFGRGLIDPDRDPEDPDSPPPRPVNALAIDASGRVLYAGTDLGVFTYTFSE